MERWKPKFNKSKCRKCTYKGNGQSFHTGPRNENILKSVYCNYSGCTGETCLTKDDTTGEVIDRRGNDPKHCLLFKKRS